jgi:hypothetical protein
LTDKPGLTTKKPDAGGEVVDSEREVDDSDGEGGFTIDHSGNEDL